MSDVVSDVFRDELFVCYCECVGGVNTGIAHADAIYVEN